jgi:hypothetical protein
MQIPSKSDVTQCKSSVNLMPIKCQLMPIYANLTSNQCQLKLDRHASAQITPILYQSEATCAEGRGTSVLQGDLPKCLDGGRFSARHVAWVWTNATPIEPLQHHSSQSCANLMSIQCQSSAVVYLMSIHRQPIPIRCQITEMPIPTIHRRSNSAQIHFQLIGNQ